MGSERGIPSDAVNCPLSTVNRPTVLRVAEGQACTADDGTPCRIFSVVLSRTAGEDLGIVATAVDPRRRSIVNCQLSPVRVPAPGEPHPTLAGYTAKAPLIFSVGLRSKDGAMLAACSNFYNVRVRYTAAIDNGQGTMDSGQGTMDSGQGTMDSGQGTIDSGQGTIDNAEPDPAANHQLSTANRQLPTAHCPLSTVNCQLPTGEATVGSEP